MNIADLTAFCQSWGGLSQPFHSNNFVYATNGSLAVRIPIENFEGPLPENGTRDVVSYAEKLDGYLNAELSDLESHTLRNFDFEMGPEACAHCEGEGKLYACGECDGSGEISYSTDYHDYGNECESCNGRGYFSKSQWEREFWRSDINYADTEECEECGGTGVLEGNPDIYIGGLRFQGKLLKEFMQFEGAVVFTRSLTPALIKWDKGEGILMPMRDQV